MGKYSVPKRTRAMRPKGTMVKAIGGHYYESPLSIEALLQHT